MHATHAVPDLRTAGGRLGDGFLSCVAVHDRRFKNLLFRARSKPIFEVRGAKLSMVRRPLNINVAISAA